jgi:hypothetical protein
VKIFPDSTTVYMANHEIHEVFINLKNLHHHQAGNWLKVRKNQTATRTGN